MLKFSRPSTLLPSLMVVGGMGVHSILKCRNAFQKKVAQLSNFDVIHGVVNGIELELVYYFFISCSSSEISWAKFQYADSGL